VAAVYNQGEQLRYPLDACIQTTTFLPQEGRLRSMAFALRKPFVAYLKKHAVDAVLLIGDSQGFLALPSMLSYRKPAYLFCDHGSLASQSSDAKVELLLRLASKFADATVTLTHQSRAEYIRRFKRDPRKMFAIHNWAPPELLSQQKNYDAEAQTLFWAGRLSAEKGPDLLLAIAQNILPKFPAWRWLVFGEGELAKELESGIAAAGLAGQLILESFKEDFYAQYVNCGIVTLTSYREGLPLVLLEAKALGIPMISFDVTTGPREIIRDGVDGFLIECYDIDSYAQRLGELMGSTELRKRMSAASQDTIATFDPEEIYLQWRRLIEDLTAEPGTGR
jgi:glycosyltransferase involved in cell wall biosynthesis